MRFSKLAGTLVLSIASVLAFHTDAESHGRRHYRYYRAWPYWGGYYAYPAFYYGGFYGPRYPYARGYYYSPLDRAPAALRIEVKPVEAEVYVDSYLAGIVDEFDGFFQRLDLAPGNHEIVIHLEGHRTIREKLHFSPGGSYKIRRVMEPLAAGEAGEPPPEPPPAERQTAVEPRSESSVSVSGFGVLELRVKPEDAEILIDGEPWSPSRWSETLIIHLSAGEHRIEVRRAGHAPFATDVTVDPGKTVTLNVKLP